MTAATSLGETGSLARSLLSLEVPLLASNGSMVDSMTGTAETLILYFYPGNEVSPEDGLRSEAHDLAQHLAFASHDLTLRSLGCCVFGVSSQSHRAQAHCAEIAGIKHLLLSDPQLSLAAALGLRTFSPGENATFYSRALLIVPRESDPVPLNVVVPGEYPGRAIAWLRERTG